ncbi:MAG: dihydroorotate dehydrogenase electron transfer subunit [Candidatus Lokiarchaeota archaeon]|nr:dihydroorotate dehydrogenase electron transfer subunit [Candidatus Lokiarchaeota archaeon]MBD3340295.1 dihydroorotate dehydrogenase electron transfer subunit [Candidatus Lokiarchaeota archaeon]
MYFEKIKKGWKELSSEIIQTGKCVYCGGCGAFCANIKFDAEKEIPIEDGSCEEMNTCRDGYGLCYNLCVKTGIDQIPTSLLDKWVFGKKQDDILGHYIEIVSVRLTDKAKEKLPIEAGPLTALLYIAMEEGLIDSAIITDNDENFRPYPIIAETKEDLFKGIGYKPSQSPTLSLIGDTINKGNVDIAVVGPGCQIQGLRKIQNHPRFDYEAYDLVSLAIGTFCFGTFHNQRLNEVFKDDGIDLSQISKIETDKDNFKMIVYANGAKKEIPLNKIYDKSIRNACFSCSDYTASFSDISVGNIGSDDEWKTLIIRTERGKQLYDLVLESGFLEDKSLDKDNEETILDITRRKTDISPIEKVVTHSPKIKSFWIRNSRIARAYRPGMFVVLWLPDIDFLPMSISAVEGNLLEITVQKIGEGTEKLFELNEGDTIGIRGPYGNSWNYEDASNILVVGGGMGIAAVTSLIEPLKKNKKNIFIAIGAKDEPSLIFADRLIDWIPSTLCTTDDGSVGKKCFVTDTIEEIIDRENIDLIMTCGPEVMMKRVFEIAKDKKIEIQASLERKMKCGVGLCGSCCVGENNDISVCKDGPIFTSEQLKIFPQFGTYSK